MRHARHRLVLLCGLVIIDGCGSAGTGRGEIDLPRAGPPELPAFMRYVSAHEDARARLKAQR